MKKTLQLIRQAECDRDQLILDKRALFSSAAPSNVTDPIGTCLLIGQMAKKQTKSVV